MREGSFPEMRGGKGACLAWLPRGLPGESPWVQSSLPDDSQAGEAVAGPSTQVQGALGKCGQYLVPSYL